MLLGRDRSCRKWSVYQDRGARWVGPHGPALASLGQQAPAPAQGEGISRRESGISITLQQQRCSTQQPFLWRRGKDSLELKQHETPPTCGTNSWIRSSTPQIRESIRHSGTRTHAKQEKVRRCSFTLAFTRTLVRNYVCVYMYVYTYKYMTEEELTPVVLWVLHMFVHVRVCSWVSVVCLLLMYVSTQLCNSCSPMSLCMCVRMYACKCMSVMCFT